MSKIIDVIVVLALIFILYTIFSGAKYALDSAIDDRINKYVDQKVLETTKEHKEKMKKKETECKNNSNYLNKF